MQTSPFEIFRRNLKPLMVLLTGLALFSFVVLPVVDSYMRRNAGTGGDAVVARYDGKELTRNRVEYFTRNHHATVQFLAKLAQETLDRGGIPRTAGFQYDPQTKRVVQLGINQNPGEQGTIRTMMFAEQANQEGFELDDNAIRVWLEKFTDGAMSDADIDGLLMLETNRQMARPHLYEQLRNHLLADIYLKRGYSGLYFGDNPSAGALLTPAEQWSAFKKLNRSATVDAYGVLVSDFVDQTNPNPPAELIQATYDEGKERDPNDESPDPAFHRRYTASFQYLVGNLQQFIDEEVAKLSEEQLRAEYEKRLAGGAFQLPDENLEQAIAEPDTAIEPADNEPAEGEPAETEASEQPADEPATDEPATDEPATDEPATDEPATDEPATEQPMTEEQPAEEPATEEQPAEETPAEEQPAEENSSAILAPRAVMLVAALQETETAEETTPEPEAEPTVATPDTTAEEPAEKPAQEPGEEPAETPEEPTAEEPMEPAAEEPSSEVPEQPASEQPASEQPAAEQPAAGESSEESKSEESKPRVQSFEDVRQRLAEELAFPAAQQRMSAAAKQIQKEMQHYFNQKAIHDANVLAGQAGDPPQKPDLQALAEQFGFQLQTIGPHDRVSIAADPISTSMDPETQFGSRGPNFTLMMFGYALGDNVYEPLPLFSPLQTTDFMSGNTYLSWKTEAREAYTPTLDEVRDEVIRFLRMKEARELAQAAAEEVAKQAAEDNGKTLADLVPEAKQANFHQGLGPFKWLDTFGRGVTMGNVPQLDAVGDDFMAAVFEAEPGELRVAPNNPRRVFYVVKPIKFEPSIDELQQQFREPNNRRNLVAIDAGIGGVLTEFYKSLDERAGFDDLSVGQP
jgi:hypothetical protein